MYHFMNKKLEKQEPVDDLITVRPQVFDFSFSHPYENPRQLTERDRTNSIRYKDSLPSSFHTSREEFVWKPKLPCKKIFDDPKFLLSLERKKVRVINGLRDGQFQINQIHRTELKNLKKKNKKLTTPRPKIFSQPQKLSDTYVHTSLNLQASQTHRTAKTPYLNFNLHHLIKQRKQANTQQHQNHEHKNQIKQIPKAGSNLPYYALFKSQRFDRTLRPYQFGQEGDNVPGRGQVRTAQTRQKNRLKYRCKNNKSTAQQKRVFVDQHEQPADA